jgi:small subunit ribosomal protein S13
MARIAGRHPRQQTRRNLADVHIRHRSHSAQKNPSKAGVDLNKKVKDWTEEEAGEIERNCGRVQIEGVLCSEVQLNIKRLMDIGCYRGLRHRKARLFVVSAPRITRVPVRASARPLPVRKAT